MGIPPRLLAAGLSASLALAVTALYRDPDGPGRAGRSAVVSPPPRVVEVYQCRSDAKDRVVDQVTAGELDLFGAAAHFRQINHEPPELASLAYTALPGGTDEEKLCRQVIRWLRARNPGRLSPSETEQVAAGLEDALATRYGRGADPAPPPDAVVVGCVE